MSLVLFQEQLTGNLVTPCSSFFTSYSPAGNTVSLFVDSMFMVPNLFFTVQGNEIRTAELIPTTSTVFTMYQYLSADMNLNSYASNLVQNYQGAVSIQEVLSVSLSADTANFTLQHNPLSGSLQVHLNGVLQAQPTDYTLNGSQIVAAPPFPAGYTVLANYQYSSFGPSTTVVFNGTPAVPAGFRGSTTLNPVIRTYEKLKTRILNTLGYPIIDIEACDDVIYDQINIAIEWYSKYAGMTEEFLVFSSDLYREPGLQIDKLFSLTPSMRTTLSTGQSACWDYDLNDYRKVIGVFDFYQGESTGINTLFTLEQAMAQQTYFSYMLGNVGFDLVTWHVLKDWLNLREKVLAQIPYVDFDYRKQLLRVIPPPVSSSRYYGVVGCWVERTIGELVMERWVYQYALSLVKITVGNIRGKYGSVQMFGGGTINYNDLLSQGLQEKEKLENELLNGYGEVTPPRFFVG